jgi:hypothetical protein
MNYESLTAHCSECLKEGMFVDNTFRETLKITKVWSHIKLRKSEGTLLYKSEGRNIRWQHLQRHIANYESLQAHWIAKVRRKECSLTTLSEAHCELLKFENTLLQKSEGRNVHWQHPQMHIVNYESLKAHWIMKVWRHIALKVWRMERSLTTPSEARCELRKSEGTLNYESLKAHCSESLKEWTFIDNTCRGTLRIMKVWRHIELWKSEGRNVRWQHLQRHIVNYESLKAH